MVPLRMLLIAAVVSSGLLVGILVLVVVGRVPLKYNVSNLIVRWRTTLLTALAFTLVIGVLTVMLAFVNGMYALTRSSGHPDNVIVLSEGATDEGFSNFAFSDLGDIETQDGILRDGETPLVSRETYLVINQPIANPRPGRPKKRFLQVRGIDDPRISGRVHGLELREGGEWFSEAGVREVPASPAEDTGSTAIEVVLGEGIARELAQDRTDDATPNESAPPLAAGDSFWLDERQWLVVGVMKSDGTVFGSEVWGKRGVIGPLFGKDNYTTLVLKTAGPKDAERLANFFNDDYDKAALKAQTEPQYFASLDQTNKQFLGGALIVTAIMAFGGVMGVMNTMFAAVSQRTKDIGVLQLLGYSRWRILVSFLLEAILIALIGGLIGCAIGSLAHGWSATSIVSSGPGGKSVVLRLTVDLTVIAIGMMLSLAMGFLGGLFPAFSAVRLRPLEALR